MIRWDVHPDYETLSHRAAAWLLERLRGRPDALVCLAAGSTPNRTYELLAEHGAREPTVFARCRLIKLDEWGGLPMDDPATCEHQLRHLLITPLALTERYIAFDSDPRDPNAECSRIAGQLTANGPIDVCVLGLGINGHLGFNEPADSLQLHAHVAKLSPSSLSHEMLRRSSHRPNYGMTLGMADLLESREILLIANGPAKREPLRWLKSGQLSTTFPASLLHLHSQVTVLCDQAAVAAD